ncbi:TetR/AcrR family transcriptional regulator [Variovorax sp. KK3]|uniref:TetR/AcrR family transcriptional regulator n=1 Tax=Variovorax sp. KK3 TaxID=1855728 RepID=UPI00097BABC3|nr:TetR family transcriptional regulator [Variovorax sp. KK3]
MINTKEASRLDVSRHATRLFLEKGVTATSADDIAAAAGISRRTFWRYFRTKESSVEPLFNHSSFRFVSQMSEWKLDTTIEAFIHGYFALATRPERDVSDDVLCALLIARLPMEPGLREAWLMANHKVQAEMAKVVARRARRHSEEFDVQLCAATIIAAMRTVDEHITDAVINQKKVMTMESINDFLARAIRTASTLPICDAIKD